MEKLKPYWKIAVIVGLLIVIYFQFNKTETLIATAKENEIKANFYLELYKSSLQKEKLIEEKYNILVEEKSKIKTIYNEKIKLIDRYSISDMQLFFDKRTK